MGLALGIFICLFNDFVLLDYFVHNVLFLDQIYQI